MGDEEQQRVQEVQVQGSGAVHRERGEKRNREEDRSAHLEDRANGMNRLGDRGDVLAEIGLLSFFIPSPSQPSIMRKYLFFPARSRRTPSSAASAVITAAMSVMFLRPT